MKSKPKVKLTPELLRAMGFRENQPGWWWHDALQFQFHLASLDPSVQQPEALMLRLYECGRSRGEGEVQIRVRRALGL